MYVCVQRTVAMRTTPGMSTLAATPTTTTLGTRIVSPRLSDKEHQSRHIVPVDSKTLDKEPNSHPKGKQYLS